MGKDLKKIFYGLLIIFININIAGIDIVNDIFGYVLIVSGLNNLYDLTKNRKFKISKYIYIVQLTVYFLSMFLNSPFSSSTQNMYLPIVIGLMLQILAIYYMYEGLINLNLSDELRESVGYMKKVFISIIFIIAVLYTFIINLQQNLQMGIAIFSVILGVTANVALLFNINKIRKEVEIYEA